MCCVLCVVWYACGMCVWCCMRVCIVCMRLCAVNPQSCIALWGETNYYDATSGDYSQNTLIEGNIFREFGLYQKQSSAVFQAKSCLTTIRYNMIWNGPRAGKATHTHNNQQDKYH